jgi:hypothetical protein
MNVIEEITIPLLTNPPNLKTRIIEWHVVEGYEVVPGQVIMDVEIDGEMYSLESCYDGVIYNLAKPDSVHSYGAAVGAVLCKKNSLIAKTIGVDLTQESLMQLDSIRGTTSRRDMLTRTLNDALNSLYASRKNDKEMEKIP